MRDEGEDGEVRSLRAVGGRGELVRWEYAKDNPRLQRRLVFQKLKDSARAIDKVIRFYQRDVSRLLDICRQQIVFERVEDMSHCLAVIRQDAEVSAPPLHCRCTHVLGGFRA